MKALLEALIIFLLASLCVFGAVFLTEKLVELYADDPTAVYCGIGTEATLTIKVDRDQKLIMGEGFLTLKDKIKGDLNYSMRGGEICFVEY